MKDREAGCAAVHGVAESDITEQLSNNKFNINIIFVAVQLLSHA